MSPAEPAKLRGEAQFEAVRAMLTKHQPSLQSVAGDGKQCARFIGQNPSLLQRYKPSMDGGREASTVTPCRAGTATMRPRDSLRRPAILTRRLWSLVIRSFVIATMSFGVAFGFLSATLAHDRTSTPMRSHRRRGLVRRCMRRDGHIHFPHPPDEGGVARTGGTARPSRRPPLGNQGSARARQEFLRGTRRRHRAPRRQRRDHIRQ